jgi:hypothetical protein
VNVSNALKLYNPTSIFSEESANDLTTRLVNISSPWHPISISEKLSVPPRKMTLGKNFSRPNLVVQSKPSKEIYWEKYLFNEKQNIGNFELAFPSPQNELQLYYQELIKKSEDFFRNELVQGVFSPTTLSKVKKSISNSSFEGSSEQVAFPNITGSSNELSDNNFSYPTKFVYSSTANEIVKQPTSSFSIPIPPPIYIPDSHIIQNKWNTFGI